MKAICSLLAAACALFAWSQNLGFAQDATPATATPESTPATAAPDSKPTAPAETPTGFGELTVQVNLSGATNRTLVVPVDREAFGEELEDQSLIVGKDGGMANVLVVLWRKDAPPAAAAPAETVELSVVDGNFQPRIVPMRAGQTLNLTNPTPVAVNFNLESLDVNPPFNLQSTANPPLNAIVPPKGVQTVRLDQVETDPVPLTCNIHPWMRAYIFPHAYPFAGVTDREGRVTFEHVPLGMWTVALWHENTGFFAGRECDVQRQDNEVLIDVVHINANPEFAAKPVSDPPEPEIRVYYLTEANADIVLMALSRSKERLGRIGDLYIRRANRINSIELRGTAFDLSRYGALIQRLDVPPPPPNATAAIPGRGNNEPAANTNPAAREQRVFQFKFIEANAAGELLRQVYRGELRASALRSRSLLVQAPKERLDEVEALLKRVDQAPVADNANNYGAPDPKVKPIAPSSASPVENLREQYQAREKEAAAAAEDYRLLDSSQNDSKSQEARERLKAVVRERVAAAFAARQALQRAELEQLRAAQARIEQQIEARERIEDKIIDRRVEELIQPETAWQPAELPPNSAASRTPGEAPAQDGEASSPLGPPQLAHIISVDDAARLVEISVGVGDGVKPGDRLEVFRLVGRDGAAAPLSLGVLEVIKVSTNHSAARIVTETATDRVRKGDYVSRIPVGWTPPDPKATPAEAAAKPPSAGSDLEVLEAKLAALQRKYNDARARGVSSALVEARGEVDVALAEVAKARRDREVDLDLARIDLEAVKLQLDSAKNKLADAERSKHPPDSASARVAIAELTLAVRQAELEVQRAKTKVDALTPAGASTPADLQPPEKGAKVENAEAQSLLWNLLGAKLEPIDPATIANTRFRGGLRIQDLKKDGPAEKAGLRRDDVLVGLKVWETISIDNAVYALLSLSRPEGAADLGRIPAYVLRGNETLSAVLSFAP